MNKVKEEFVIRFNRALSIRNMKPSELSEKTGFSRSTISHYMSGYTKPKSDKLFVLAKALDVDEAWLMGLDVPMERNTIVVDDQVADNPFNTALKKIQSGDELTEEEKKLVSETMPQIIQRVSDTLKESIKKLIPDFDNIYPIGSKKYPLLGEIACGEPIFCNEERDSYVVSGTDINADFCLKARGDSMINARILDGDIVFIHEQPEVENGQIAAVIIGEEATLKRVNYYPEQSMIILKPENPRYPDIILQNEALNDVRILGKAVAFQSDVK